MRRMDLLRELFDEKIIRILNIFLEDSNQHFSLTRVSSLSGVHVATTLRIIDKLLKKDILELIVVGKSKSYKLKQGEKTLALSKLLRREEHLSEFVDKIKQHPRVRKIVLESKTSEGAKILIVGDFLPMAKINSLIDEIRRKFHFVIQFVEITERQFSEMERLGLYNIDKKIIWEQN